MVKQIIILDIVGLEYEHLQSGLTPNISKIAEGGESAEMEPVFPAVTCTVQASILSGEYPNKHGIISNGLYDRNSYTVSFWEQASSLVQTDRIWDILNKKSLKTAALFLQNTMYASADFIVTPRPLHMDDGVVSWCYSKPVGYYEELKEKFGEFNLRSYWGPFASEKSSEWISKVAEYTLEKNRPNLMFVYIPHIDYSAQRHGKKSGQVKDDLKKADNIVASMLQKTSDLGIQDDTQFIILSEYGFNDVSDAIPINLELRDAGLLATRTIQGKEYLDYEFSKAFAMVDHQLAHVYVKDDFIDETKRILENVKGVDKVLLDEEKKSFKINHERSGEIIAVSDRDKWFSYQWWHELEKAPNFAKTVDIHRKPGYDPLELFFDQKIKSIPSDPTLIKGSHGRPPNPTTGEGLAVYVSSHKTSLVTNSTKRINCVNVGQYLIEMVSR